MTAAHDLNRTNAWSVLSQRFYERALDLAVLRTAVGFVAAAVAALR